MLPTDYLATLTSREPIREGHVALVAPDRVWDVRTTFGLDEGDSSDQLDRVYELVGDVLPTATLPFAEDWGGNFYCLILSGPKTGQVVWWSHERDPDDDAVEPVATSVSEFYTRLVIDPRE